MRAFVWVWMVILLGAVTVACGAEGAQEDPVASPSSQPGTAKSITAEELYYVPGRFSDPLAFREAYAGKTLIVTGSVVSKGTDPNNLGGAYVAFGDPTQRNSMFDVCFVEPENASFVTRVSKGDQITVRAKLMEDRLHGYKLEDCTLVR